MPRINQEAYSRVGYKPNLIDSQPMLLTIAILPFKAEEN